MTTDTVRLKDSRDVARPGHSGADGIVGVEEGRRRQAPQDHGHEEGGRDGLFHEPNRLVEHAVRSYDEGADKRQPLRVVRARDCARRVLELSRRNSNVRSLALSPGWKRTLTAACARLAASPAGIRGGDAGRDRQAALSRRPVAVLLLRTRLPVRQGQPLAEVCRRFVRRAAIERHRCGGTAGDAGDLGPPFVETHARDFDAVRASVDDGVESLNVHIRCRGSQ